MGTKTWHAKRWPCYSLWMFDRYLRKLFVFSSWETKHIWCFWGHFERPEFGDRGSPHLHLIVKCIEAKRGYNYTNLTLFLKVDLVELGTSINSWTRGIFLTVRKYPGSPRSSITVLDRARSLIILASASIALIFTSISWWGCGFCCDRGRATYKIQFLIIIDYSALSIFWPDVITLKAL